MKVYTSKTIMIQVGNEKPIRFTDPAKAAEYWARVKEEEWIEKNIRIWKSLPVPQRLHARNMTLTLHGNARIRYRKMRRRAQKIFRRIMEINT